MNLSTLQSRAAGFAGDVDQTRFGSLYPGAINDAQKQFVLDSNALFDDQSYTTVAGTAVAGTLPTDFIVEDTVTYDGKPLKPVSRHTLYTLYQDTDWSILSGTPKYYMTDPEEGTKGLRLVPIPTEAKTVSMRYVALPADVANGTDVVLNSSTLMTQFHLGIAAFAAWLLLVNEQQTPDIEAKCRKLMAIYSDAVNKAIEKFGNTKSEPLRIRPIK